MCCCTSGPLLLVATTATTARIPTTKCSHAWSVGNMMKDILAAAKELKHNETSEF